MLSFPYLYQTPQWQQFWLKTHDAKHECIEINALKGDLSLKGYVYVYQWRFGQRLMHIPAGPFIESVSDSDTGSNNDGATGLATIDKQLLLNLYLDFLSKVLEIGKNYQAVALRVNFDPALADILGIKSSEDFRTVIINNNAQQMVGLPVLTKGRLMFPAIAVIDLDAILPPVTIKPITEPASLPTAFSSPSKTAPLTDDKTTSQNSHQSHNNQDHPTSNSPRPSNVSLSALEQFMRINKEYWLSTSETTRKQTRRTVTPHTLQTQQSNKSSAAKPHFHLNTEVSTANIKRAHDLMSNTSSRQGFTLPPLDYFQTMSQEPFFHLLLIEDEEGAAHTAWIGLTHNDVLTNQYAGNDEIAFKHFLPNLSHLYGMYLAKQLGCRWYDLGGYEKGSRQARFKDGYRPEIIDFVGGVDLVYLPWYYRLIELGGKSKKLLKK